MREPVVVDVYLPDALTYRKLIDGFMADLFGRMVSKGPNGPGQEYQMLRFAERDQAVQFCERCEPIPQVTAAIYDAATVYGGAEHGAA